MLIKIKKSWEIPENQVTPERLYLSRRSIMKSVGLAAGAAMLTPLFHTRKAEAVPDIKAGERIDYADGEKLNDYEDITGYNNYYEFGTGKGDPAKNAHTLKTEPWSVTVDGLCEKPGTYALEDLIDFNALEERIYRLRCVEAWSMVIPWVGVPLNSVLKKLGPKAEAKFVRFETLTDRSQMPGISSPVLDWPYKEGLRMDEAMNDLAFLVVGLYGKILPNQNGAPLRLAVPWKYGFKSIKSIVRISLVEEMPMTTWWQQNPREYGFYSNVNPNVDHPRWSQSRERRIGEFFKRETLMFNGYGEEVAEMYKGMDLSKYF